MKIHSDFKDYYDIGLSVGVDKSLHYDRRERGYDAAEVGLSGIYESMGRYLFSSDHNVEHLIVGFCGTLYPCVAIHWRSRPTEYIYNSDRLREVFPDDLKYIRRFGRKHYKSPSAKHSKFVQDIRRNRDGIFRALNAPTFVYCQEEGGNDLRVNANASLKDVQFFKVVDPVTAFQEISMYLGNYLVKRDVPDTIADEYRIAMHGFDKRSFRHPTRLSALK